jgi:hypothetical protein
MLAFYNKYKRWFRWAGVILIFFSPVIILRIFGRDNILGMIISLNIIWTMMALIFFILGLNPKTSILETDSILRNKFKDSSIKKWDRILRICFVICALYACYSETIPIYLDTIDYVVSDKIEKGNYTIAKLSSLSGKDIWLIKFVKLQEQPERKLEYYFAPKYVRESNKYDFTIFTRSNIILLAKKL